MRENAGVQATEEVQYLSQAWAEEVLRLIETDARIKQALHGLSISILSIVLNPPKGCYGFLYAAFDEGGLVDFRTGHDFNAVAKGLPEPTFAISGDYKVFAAIQRRDLGERRALLTGQLHLTGSLLKAMRHMHILETITAVTSTIPCKT